MPLESGVYISDLIANNPAATDGLGQADDHFRLLKSTIKTTFPNVSGEVSASHTNLNLAASIATNGVSKLLDAGAYFAGDPDTGILSTGADALALRTHGVDRVTVSDTGAAVTGTFATSGAFTGGTGQLVPTGTVLDYAGATEPAGFLFCAGQAISRTTYAALFALLGTFYGAGDTTTTFNLPDLQGRVVAGRDNMSGVSANRLTTLEGGINGDTLGGVGGVESHTLTAAQIPDGLEGTTSAETVTTKYQAQQLTSGAAGSGLPNVVRTPGTGSDDSVSEEHEHTVTVGGGGLSHPNVQPTFILNKIIKT